MGGPPALELFWGLVWCWVLCWLQGLRVGRQGFDQFGSRISSLEYHVQVVPEVRAGEAGMVPALETHRILDEMGGVGVTGRLPHSVLFYAGTYHHVVDLACTITTVQTCRPAFSRPPGLTIGRRRKATRRKYTSCVPHEEPCPLTTASV